MATVKTVYLGGYRTEATHLKSGNKIITDAPVDNHGKGEYFSPTDLVAAALTSCSFTIMGIAAERHGFSIDGATASTTKVMSQDTPRRITEIIIEFEFPQSYDAKIQRILELSPKQCPVGNSLGSDVQITLSFKYGK